MTEFNFGRYLASQQMDYPLASNPTTRNHSMNAKKMFEVTKHLAKVEFGIGTTTTTLLRLCAGGQRDTYISANSNNTPQRHTVRTTPL
jgi:hypothetical protein